MTAPAAEKDTHPQVCDGCKYQAVTRQDQVVDEYQDHQAAPVQKAGGWFSRWRT
ncbi:hypothetical protein [Streptomyces sp. IB2014 016-6]|uniref:hypothetical protein n=1 Tax=Streptomyces sp. IB2014 016-6 TaxID=2517818 RepID=UPI00164EF92B|nr:hypothetical protein [Streptomyces sp. IB2014 016-6]